ncbi:hypothetical protein [Nocardiopsis sp. JB363]|uniref:hypothetical protein n=1 Tax=Nocardiopsis sp. JB363 TaxID=1434837 RepID=UPI000B35048B|nr:hypothetical protein [Nocardiopsis sp. JB363]
MSSQDRHQEEQGDMPAAATESPTDIVQVSARIPRGLRQRLKIAAALDDLSTQDALKKAIEEFAEKRKV